jgi:hypothetical protein
MAIITYEVYAPGDKLAETLSMAYNSIMCLMFTIQDIQDDDDY